MVRRRLTDWDSDDEDAATIAAKAKYSRLVVLQGMFTLKELEEDATLLLDLKEDVRDECETLGEVTNVTLYDVRHFPPCDGKVADRDSLFQKEDEGILTVRFKEEAPAQACIAVRLLFLLPRISLTIFTAENERPLLRRSIHLRLPLRRLAQVPQERTERQSRGDWDG